MTKLHVKIEVDGPLEDFLEKTGASGHLSRLTLVVIIGKLQSPVPVMAGNIGVTFLWHLLSIPPRPLKESRGKNQEGRRETGTGR